MNRRGFLATLFVVPFAPLAWKLAPTAIVYRPLAYTSAATAEQLEALRRYNYAVSQWADTLMLAPKAPWLERIYTEPRPIRLLDAQP